MKQVLVLMKHGHEEVEALTVVDLLRRAGISVSMVSCEAERTLHGAHGIQYTADCLLAQRPASYDAIAIPGGVGGAQALAQDEAVCSLLREAWTQGKVVSAICAGPMVLEAAGILEGRTITCYPGFEEKTASAKTHRAELVVQDGNLITSRGPATAMLFALTLVERLGGEDARHTLEEELLWPLLQVNAK